MKQIMLTIILIHLLAAVAGQMSAPKIQVGTPEDKASVIKKFEKIEFEVTDIDRSVTKVHRMYTVLNENGARALSFAEYTDRFSSIEDVEINVFDANGKSIGKYRKKDLQKSAIGSGLIDDGYVVHFQVPVTRYPVSVEYKYEERRKGTMFYPSYDLLLPGERVESSSFTAKIAKELDLRFQEKNTSIKPTITEDEKYKFYNWKVSNLAGIEYEEGSINDHSKYPTILLAPNKFKYDNYTGDFSTWKSFGEFFYELNKGRDELPKEKVLFFRELVKNATNDRDKARILYNYLQENFRYVSIQLGIGGFQTFTAEFTEQKKYGDCKALSNYMRAALKAVGINSYLAVIRSGVNAGTLEANFPMQSSNHMILCVPNNKDTIWLECTSKINEFGVLGVFTENRHAILLTENGGVFVSTPGSRSAENVFSRKSNIVLDADGSGTIEQVLDTKGEYREFIEYMKDEKPADLKEMVVKHWGLKLPEEIKIDLGEKKTKTQPRINAYYSRIPEFVAGTKMFLAPRMNSLWNQKMPTTSERKSDYYFSYPMIMIDSTSFKLPENYIADALPQKKEFDCGYASYVCNYYFDAPNQTLLTTARLEIKEHHIPAKEYQTVKSFFDKVLLEDAQRVVIKKQ